MFTFSGGCGSISIKIKISLKFVAILPILCYNKLHTEKNDFRADYDYS
jgi:hypothetical protein